MLLYITFFHSLFCLSHILCRGHYELSPTGIKDTTNSKRASKLYCPLTWIICDVWMSESFLVQRWPGTNTHTCKSNRINIVIVAWRNVYTSNGRYVCFSSFPTCRQGRWGNCSLILCFSLKYWTTLQSTVSGESGLSCIGNLNIYTPS